MKKCGCYYGDDCTKVTLCRLNEVEEENERLQAEAKKSELLWWDEKGELEDRISELQAENERLKRMNRNCKMEVEHES